MYHYILFYPLRRWASQVFPNTSDFVLIQCAVPYSKTFDCAAEMVGPNLQSVSIHINLVVTIWLSNGWFLGHSIFVQIELIAVRCNHH